MARRWRHKYGEQWRRAFMMCCTIFDFDGSQINRGSRLRQRGGASLAPIGQRQWFSWRQIAWRHLLAADVALLCQSCLDFPVCVLCLSLASIIKAMDRLQEGGGNGMHKLRSWRWLRLPPCVIQGHTHPHRRQDLFSAACLAHHRRAYCAGGSRPPAGGARLPWPAKPAAQGHCASAAWHQIAAQLQTSRSRTAACRQRPSIPSASEKL